MTKSLKEQREKLGIELNEVARITRIRAGYLKAIEEEDFARLPAEVYARGYIREYARFLGCPAEPAIARYEAYLKEANRVKEIEPAKRDHDKKIPVQTASEVIEKPPSHKLESIDHSQGSSEMPIKKRVFSGKDLSQRILVAVSMAGIALLIYLLLPGEKNAPPVPQKTEPGVQYKIPDTTPSVPAQDAEQEKTAQSSPAVLPDKAGDKNKTVQKKKHNLDITAIDKTWIQIIIDGTDKSEALLNPGEKVNYEANQSIDVLIGNAGGVKLKFDGKEFDRLGEKGQVIKLTLPPMPPPPPQPTNNF